MQITLDVGFVVMKDNNIAGYVLEDKRMEAKKVKTIQLLDDKAIKAQGLDIHTEHELLFSNPIMCFYAAESH